MYPKYFGLKEASFSITPDPQYLYLSPRHREALAHLLYGAGESGGFVLLTGEVGTGKTTICRAFLEQLPEHVDLALILNPALSVPELLHAVGDEFGVEIPEKETSSKVMVDLLNVYLLDAHAKGRHPVLMIDEAQNLKPEVLEQIRLLTNLETHKHKLLQIFLVGQPELRELLQQRNLRQLAQRITARYHLTPLQAEETADYIRHRLAVAGVKRALFKNAALRRIHRLSGGVPRIINILCDRALLGAFATESQQVDKRIVSRAWREIQGGHSTPGWRQVDRSVAFGTLALLLVIGLGWLGYIWTYRVNIQPEPLLADTTARPKHQGSQILFPSETAKSAEQVEPVEQLEKAEQLQQTEPVDPVSTPAPPLEAKLEVPSEDPPQPATELTLPDAFILEEGPAMDLLLEQWGKERPVGFTGSPCLFVETWNLRCRPGSGDWERLSLYRRPALLTLRKQDGLTGYALITGLDATHAEFRSDSGEVQVPRSAIDSIWSGEFLILWQPAPGNTTLIGTKSSGESIRWLRQTLDLVPTLSVDEFESGIMDIALQTTVATFQIAHGLQADGIAGPETLIQLNAAAGLPDIPLLRTPVLRQRGLEAEQNAPNTPREGAGGEEW